MDEVTKKLNTAIIKVLSFHGYNNDINEVIELISDARDLILNHD